MTSHGLARWTAIVLLVLPPLFYVPGLHEPFRLPKQVASEVLAWLLLAAASRAAARWQGPRVRGALVALLPLSAVVALSTLLSDHSTIAMRATLGFAVGASALLCFASDEPSPRELLDWIVVPATFLSAIALLQYGLGSAEAGPEAVDARLRLGSLAGNVGDLTAYLVLPALVAQWRLREERQHRSRWRTGAWSAALMLWVGTLLVARTLTPIAALTAGTLVFWAAGAERRSRRLPVIPGLLALLLVAAALVTPLGSRIAAEWREVQNGAPQDVLSGRLDGWRAGLYIGSEQPALGVGPGAFRAEFAKAKRALAGKGVAFYQGHGRATHFEHAHSEPIELFADLGVAGLAAVVWLGWVLARRARELASPGDRAFAFAALAAFLVLACFWFPLRVALVSWPYVVLGGWLLGATPSVADPAERDSQTYTAMPHGVRRPRRWSPAAATVLLVAAALLSAYSGLQRLRANRILELTEKRTTAMAAEEGALDRAELRRNLAALETAAAHVPDDERIPLAIGSHYLLLGDLAAAEVWYSRSLEVAPRAEAYLNLGRVAWLRGDLEAARPLFASATILTPALAPEVPAPPAP